MSKEGIKFSDLKLEALKQSSLKLSVPVVQLNEYVF